MEMHTLKFSGENKEFLEMRIRAPSVSERRSGWLEVDATISVQGFQGNIQPSFELDDFSSFAAELGDLYNALTGKAVLNSREQQLYFSMTGNGRGQIQVEGHAYSSATYGNKLNFSFAIDQTCLPSQVRVLETLASERAGSPNHSLQARRP